MTTDCLSSCRKQHWGWWAPKRLGPFPLLYFRFVNSLTTCEVFTAGTDFSITAGLNFTSKQTFTSSIMRWVHWKHILCHVITDRCICTRRQYWHLRCAEMNTHKLLGMKGHQLLATDDNWWRYRESWENTCITADTIVHIKMDLKYNQSKTIRLLFSAQLEANMLHRAAAMG